MARKRKNRPADKKLTEFLNKALADAWLAYYRFWIGAKVIDGEMKEAVSMELEELAATELKHAGILAEKIIQLQGVPVLTPSACASVANCKAEFPKDCSVKSVLLHNIKCEQEIIDAYKKLFEFAGGADSVTNELLANILDEKMEQKDTLINVLEHIEKNQ